MNLVLPFIAQSPTLSDFIVGENDEILAAIRALTAGALDETSLYIWGEPGTGKSCLLKASCRHAQAAGLPAYHVVSTPAADTMPPPLDGLLAVDNVERLPEAAQITLFDWHNRAQMQKRQYLLATGGYAPADLSLREELRTRLGGGLVFRLRPLDDEHKSRALSACAARRGFALPEDISRLLLSRLPRNMHSLEAALTDLDTFLLTQKKTLNARQTHAWMTRRMAMPAARGE